MPIDPAVAIGADLGEVGFAWTPSDVLLYHLAVGAGADPVDERELRYAYERDLRVLPTFATVAANLRTFEPPALKFPGVDVDLAKVLHGKQEIDLHRPIPVEGKAVARTRIADVFDKGKAAVLVQETEVADESGAPLWTARSSIFARGEGGFGGERGPSDKIEWPDREPDKVLDVPTLPQQALLYRLCGDRNPLHADPAFAKAAGFDRPILHGLCTYGVVAKAVVDAFLDGDPERVSAFGTKFAGVVFPGENLRVRVWRADDRLLVTATAPERDDTPVLADTVLRSR
ncbi:3-alpha,7-alpha,12-alpha-trihydroxy-5-beta-cholest-24-enoyl-CoA hydratase [Amycolatopsis rubida]|uniref:3-alpha,7-alpha, 12-alpha-trihydroxy-5-beta-cholest-24-enoyl-CoA hydratase n=1 Tax=Amycolatopsis rubida TaxID=112413 RepID=A0A1I5R0U6_9PSEU|nr:MULTISPECIES: MaoC/PaaZ C-terminal domain-containing protein [Amycolatopsis]MYW95808.1 3-alpha,7-alpha,12-alpha-trihydroxy-5-beta-cholest-24-enoyl-CoA hydratase [Amycolatopsis rubida]NEC60798.1 3-alpha,7-alpha,12-alpha-trihydroxy-5-beta-cholest-24-enoyl-CoA hydratase [Amycolatopsis rubida]OAP26734.1 MaoC like domain protein [Amycolatopsis sp. M39]SFP52010.1 Acyl dehydratase [Amycolatopsis rubida]